MSIITKRQKWMLLIILISGGFALFNYFMFMREDKPRFDKIRGNEYERIQHINTATQKTSQNVQKQRNNETENKPGFVQMTTTPRNGHANSSGLYPRCEIPDSGITIYGKIRTGHNYSVFSSTLHNEDSLHYLFELPLTALAWQRIGFGSIVLLVMDVARIANSQKVEYVLSTLFSLQAVVVILRSHHNYAVMISQVARLFVPYLIGSRCVDDATSWEDTYLVTSDADLWPLDREAYALPDNRTAILCLNAFCCGQFQHNGRSYSMMPMGNIGMRVGTWRSVARRRGFVPVSVPEMITYLSREFVEQATSAIQKGDNVGWFMDQRMISVLIAEWARRGDNAQRVKYVRRDVGRDRMDRTAWRPITLYQMVDAHILESAYKPPIWHRLEALLVLMYDQPLFEWCKKYATTFLSLT
ncbi:hypothetical protein LSH36_23g09011 [Paralvinella palmiformis]|uniref:Uncharacterized protein n=1 Tax=Paralvinella palmiformis TaxID=53620 RepID=A0AAD9KCC8_9ANNE|nr:hypothetical protein LSH36_23g09011 [Paralvinella palmiformis]